MGAHMLTIRINIFQCAAMVVVCFAALYVATCAYYGRKNQSAYDAVEFGDTEAVVIAKMGIPSVKESKEAPFYRYATNACAPPCVYRLWFENRLALDLESWSISIGTDGRVVDKYHWVSP